MKISELWAQFEREGEEEVRRKFYQGLYGMPGSQKHEAVNGWLSYRDWKRTRADDQKTSEAAKETELDDRLPLYRRGAFDRELVNLVNQSLASGEPLSLLLMDLDGFKEVNDTHGHPVGDEVLLALSKLIVRRSGAKGRPYRYGGDEITIPLPNYSVDEGAAFAEVLRREVEKSPVVDKEIKMTTSIGVATLPDHAQDGQTLLKRADEALYKAKTLGKNLVRISGEGDDLIEMPREVQRRKPTGRVSRDEDALERINQVELTVSIQSGFASHFLILISNHSDEEVSLRRVWLEADGYRLTNPAEPPSEGLWKIRRRGRLCVGWRADPDPVSKLVTLHPDAVSEFSTAIGIVLWCEILGKSRKFTEKVYVQVDAVNRRIQQLV